jgi:GcrA cell cycle regulator
MSWTDERVELLKRLWSDGCSASQIAAELGGYLTRNAVIGKVHRLGLSGRDKNPPGVTPRPRKAGRSHQSPFNGMPTKPQRTAVSPFKGAPDLPVEPLAPEPELIQDIIPIGQRCSILELTMDTCHWPIGDPNSSDFFFCGGKTIEGLPYCGYHSRIAYQPGADRRRERRLARG